MANRPPQCASRCARILARVGMAAGLCAATALAAEKPLWLVYCVGISDGMTASDGIIFRVEIGEVGKPRREVAATLHKEAAWRSCRVRLDEYRNRSVVIRLIADPHENTTEDWGLWGDVAIVEGELPEGFTGELVGQDLRVLASFVDLADVATGAVCPDGETKPLDERTGGVFRGTSGVCGGVRRKGFFSHPCFKAGYQLYPVFADFALDLAGPPNVAPSWDLRPFEESPFAAAGNYAQTPAVAAWSAATKQAQREAAGKMLTELRQAMAEGKPGYTVPPGDYRFDPSLRSQLSFTGVRDFLLDAEGATFWMEDDGGLRFTDCQGVTLRGLTLDGDPLPFSQGVILGTNAWQSFAVIRIIDGFPLPTAYQGQTMMVIPFRPDGTLIPHHMDTFGDIEPLGGAVFKVYLNQGLLLRERQQDYAPVGPGDVLVMPPRRVGTVAMGGCGQMRMEGVTCYASGGFAVAETDGPGGNVYEGIRLVRRPGTKRFIAGTADGFHSYRMVQGPRLERCELSWTCDDLVNIHGFFSMVYRVVDDRTVLIASPFGPSFAAGQEVSFYRYHDMHPAGTARIASMERVTDSTTTNDALKVMPAERKVRDFPFGVLFEVKLATPIATEKYALVADDGACGAGFVIRSSFFHDNNGRGTLLKAPGGLVEGNRYERTGMSGILLGPEQYYLEGPLVRGIVIRGNRFLECCRQLDSRTGSSHSLGSIAVVMATHGAGLSPALLNTRIRIEGNSIERSGNAGIFLANAFEVDLVGNLIRDPFCFVSLGNGKDYVGEEVRAAIQLAAASRVRITGNRIVLGPNCRDEVLLGKDVDPATVTIDK